MNVFLVTKNKHLAEVLIEKLKDCDLSISVFANLWEIREREVDLVPRLLIVDLTSLKEEGLRIIDFLRVEFVCLPVIILSDAKNINFALKFLKNNFTRELEFPLEYSKLKKIILEFRDKEGK